MPQSWPIGLCRFVCLLMLLTVCTEEDPADCEELTITDQTLRLLPLGDSRIEGDEMPQGYHSYRYYLWRIFQQEN